MRSSISAPDLNSSRERVTEEQLDATADRLTGEVVYLCWQFGEPEVAFWHGVQEGFAGRRPLPGVTPRHLQ